MEYLKDPGSPDQFIQKAQSLIFPRTEPVWWGSVSKDSWTHEYQRDGCYLFPQLLSPLPVKFWSDCCHHLKLGNFPGQILESQSSTLRSQFNVHHLAPELVRRLIVPLLIDIATSILGGDPQIYQCHINFKSARQGEAYDWHSDFTYWKSHDGMISPRAISVVFPLNLHGPKNGGIEVLRKSHRWYYLNQLHRHHQWQLDQVRHEPSGNRQQKGLVPEELLNLSEFSTDRWAPDMKCGDIFIMDANLWHQSPPNLSNLDRTTLFLILISPETEFESEDYFYRPPYISCRQRLPLRHFCNQNSLPDTLTTR